MAEGFYYVPVIAEEGYYYHSAIESLFETSGLDIGRLKDNELALEMALPIAERHNRERDWFKEHGYTYDIVAKTNADTRRAVAEIVLKKEIGSFIDNVIAGFREQNYEFDGRERRELRDDIYVILGVEKHFMDSQREPYYMGKAAFHEKHQGILGYDDLMNDAAAERYYRALAEEVQQAKETITRFSELLGKNSDAVGQTEGAAADENAEQANEIWQTYNGLSETERDELFRASLINIDSEHDEDSLTGLQTDILQAIVKQGNPKKQIWEREWSSIASSLRKYANGDFVRVDRAMITLGAPVLERARACGLRL